MASREVLIALVRQLVQAENEENRVLAEEVLAPDFIAITRRTGKEQGREDLLGAIAAPPPPNPLREFDEEGAWTQASGDLGVVRSLITTKNPNNPNEVLGRFRNLHVFEQRSQRWQCVLWQVTELK